MKRLMAILLLCTANHLALAQRESLIDHTDKWNLNTRFDASYTSLDGDGTILGGLSIGGLLNDTLGLGIRGRALIDDAEGESIGTIDTMDLWYAGAYVEYVHEAETLVYWSIDFLAGIGEVDTGFDSGDFYVFEPGIALWVNVTETLMLGLGGSYRMVQNLDLAGGEDDIFDEALGTISFRFTQF